MPASLVSRLAAPFREFGPLAGTLYLVGRLLDRTTRSMRLQVYELMVQPIPVEELRGAALAKGLEVREIRMDAPEIATMPVRPEVMASRIRQACICLGAFRRGSLVGYMWFSPDQYEEDEVCCTYAIAPAGQAVFDFDFYILPEQRMGTAFVGLWNGANHFLRARGVRYTFSRLTRFNVASRRAHAHLGWKRVGSALFLTSRKLQLMLATVPPFLNLCMRSSAGPRLRLTPDVLLSGASGRDRA